MATKRGEKATLLELRERSVQESPVKPFRPPRRDFIERTVLATDTLQGIALLYNTSVAEIKKINQLQTDGELHARRVIKVPSRGILINLEPTPSSIPKKPDEQSSSSLSLEYDSDEIEDGEEAKPGPGIAYLNSKDSVLSDLRAKVDHVAANSPIFNEGTEDHELIRKGIHGGLDRRNDSSIKWWHVLFPCLAFVILFPILLFIFQEHLHDLGHSHDLPPMSHTNSNFHHTSDSEYNIPGIEH